MHVYTQGSPHLLIHKFSRMWPTDTYPLDILMRHRSMDMTTATYSNMTCDTATFLRNQSKKKSGISHIKTKKLGAIKSVIPQRPSTVILPIL